MTSNLFLHVTARMTTCGVLLLLPSLQVVAAPAESDWQALNTLIVEQHVKPRYQAFTEASELLAVTTSQLCEQPDEAHLSAAHSAYREAMNQWQGVQHIGFGPANTLMRSFEIQYWPDRRNTTSSHLRAALSETGVVYDTDFFNSVGVSVKGFPALERLLFHEKSVSLYENMSAQCRLAAAIAGRIRDNAVAIQNEWDDTATDISSSEDGYGSSAEVATLFMKSLVEPLAVVRENKIISPLGDVYDKARWQRSESWRSEQSIQNIRTNIQALHYLFSGTHPLNVRDLLVKSGEEGLAEKAEQLFTTLQQQLDDLPEVQGTQISEQQFQQLTQVAVELHALHDVLSKGMMAMNIHLGFNSRDGD
ncbi:imelysin family protein [Nitrincola sp. MINF-07-Sa-05]|uniref:imelysin family protein n=1 Tax=Nitrincola salilacus TaxID=3400273 RepID=UPI003917EC08